MERQQNYYFYSTNNQKVACTLYFPHQFKKDKQYPAILLCQGLSGVRTLVLPAIATHFASEGFICLTFDYRGFGESEGARGYIDLTSRCEDAIQGYIYLHQLPFVDRTRMGVYGISLGGGIAPFVALQFHDTKALVTVSGFYSGQRLLRSLRTAQQWITFKDYLTNNQTFMKEGKEDALVSIEDIFPFDPSFLKKYAALKQGEQSESIPQNQVQPNQWHLSSAQTIVSFDLVPKLKDLSPCPFLIIHGELDNVIPIEDVEEAYQFIHEPKKLIIVKGHDHIDLDNGSGLDYQIKCSLEWFKAHL